MNELLLKKVNMNSVVERGSIDLLIACCNDNFEVAKFLLEKGAIPNSQDIMGNTVLMEVF